MSPNNENEFWQLVDKAKPLGFHVGEHKNFDPTRGSAGPYYLMRKKEFPAQKTPSLLRYASAKMIEDFLNTAAEKFAN